MRTATFWKLGFAYSFMTFGGTAFILFRIAHFVERGMDPVVVSVGASLEALVFGVTSVAAGFLEHRFSARRMGTLGFSGLFAAMVLGVIADSVALMLLANALWGAAAGMNNIAQQLIWASYYGRTHQGSIRGLVTTLMLAVGSTSGPICGTVREAMGSYSPAWSLAAVLLLAGAMLVATAAAPQRRSPAATS